TFANVIAPMFCFSIVVSFYYWKESLVGKKWVLLSCLGLGLSLLLTFTRGAWVGAFVGALLILGFYSWRWVVALIVTASVMGATLFYLSPEFQSRFTSIAEVNNSANMGRQALWKAHIEMIKDHPLFGVGYGAAKSNLDLYYDRLSIPQDTVKSHAHNQLLHFAAGMGIPGVFLLLSLWIYLLFFNWKLLMRIPKTQVWHRSLAVGLLGAQVCFYILSQTEATLEDSEVGYTWTLLIGLLFCVYYLTKPREINKIA
ncbi:MAG: O-antigen ligase family protein, partial [Pseudobdellovibrionaceae bacterium]